MSLTLKKHTKAWYHRLLRLFNLFQTHVEGKH